MIEFYLGGGSWSARQIGPTVTHSFTVEEAMNGITMTCRAVNAVGEKNVTETLAVFSEFYLKENFICLFAWGLIT